MPDNTTPPEPTSATLLIDGGHVFTPTGVVDGPVLVQGGVITAIGAEARVRAGSALPQIVHSAGGLVVPGFQDSHIHPFHAGLDMLACDLSVVDSAPGDAAAAYLRLIGEYAATHPDVPWITGGGWAMEAFPGGRPTAVALDSVVRDRPVFLPNRDGHGGWANTRALEIAGIDDHTPDPFDGRIERDADGHAIGTLQEGAMNLVAHHIPVPTEGELDEALLLAQAKLFSWGVTAWHDAIIGRTHERPDPLDAYLRAAASGALKARVVGALWWDRNRGLEQIPELVERRERAATMGGPTFVATAVKIMQDGILENFTAGVLEPYLDSDGHTTDNHGKSFIEPPMLNELSIQLDSLGFQLHYHALGDRAVRESLDAIEATRAANGPGGGGGRHGNRHTLAHLQLVHPDDIPRFAALGAIANIQPLWARHEGQMDELTIPFLGPRRAGWQYPFGGLARAGARLASGSDWPVTTADPLQIIHTAVNRAPYGATGADRMPFLGEQALTLTDALLAHTAGTAYLNHDEHRSGSIEIGKAADLAILDRDIFSAPAAEIGAARVTHTVVGGQVVFGG